MPELDLFSALGLGFATVCQVCPRSLLENQGTLMGMTGQSLVVQPALALEMDGVHSKPWRQEVVGG